MKLLVDMNLSPRWVDLFTRSGFEAVHWSSVGSPHALDQEIMAYAAKHDYVVLTNDLDFGAIRKNRAVHTPFAGTWNSAYTEPNQERRNSV